MEEQCNRLRHELDIIHKKLLTTLEGPKEKATKLTDMKPTNKVGSPLRPLVSSDFQIYRSRTSSPATSLAPSSRGDNSGMSDSKESYSIRQYSPIREIASPYINESRSIYHLPKMSPRVDSPGRDRHINPNLRTVASPRGRRLQNFRGIPSQGQGWTEALPSPRQPVRRRAPPILSGRELANFSNKFRKAKKERQQYPVDLVGSTRKQAYLDGDQFDSDYDSKQSSERSILINVTGRNKYPRKNVQFDQNINFFPHGQNNEEE